VYHSNNISSDLSGKLLKLVEVGLCHAKNFGEYLSFPKKEKLLLFIYNLPNP
jgi:hypothetical protein